MKSIVIDAMGGDNAPFINIEGAVQYLEHPNSKCKIILVGNEEVLNKELSKFSYDRDKLKVHHASEAVGMDESPTKSFKEKPDSSMKVGIQLVKKDIGQAFISAGNTGAVMAYSLLTLGRIKGVDRPAVGAFMPHDKGTTLLLDVGAVSVVKPKNLLQFGIMGSLVYKKFHRSEAEPKVGLLSIGEESEKGTTTVKEAKHLLESAQLNFTGFAEGRDIFTNKFDVVVTDGFTGNVALKLAEGVTRTLFRMIRKRVNSPIRKLAALFMRPTFNDLKRDLDPNTYGGSPLLGIKGISLICHGSSTSEGIKNALLEAQRFINTNLVQDLSEGIAVSLQSANSNTPDDANITQS